MNWITQNTFFGCVFSHIDKERERKKERCIVVELYGKFSPAFPSETGHVYMDKLNGKAQ